MRKHYIIFDTVKKSIGFHNILFLIMVPVVLLLLSFPEPGYCSQDETFQPRINIRLGGDKRFPPSTFIENGQPKGYIVDVIHATARAVGMKVTVVLMPWSQALEQLKSGDLDVMAMSYSDKRAKEYDFSVQFALNAFGLMVPKDSGIKNIADIKGKRVLVQQGGVMTDFIATSDIKADFTFMKNVEAIVKALGQKKYDAAFLSKKTGYYVARQFGIAGLEFTDEDINPRKTVFAVTKGNFKLVHHLNEGLSVINADGRLSEINEKWFGQVSDDLISLDRVKTWSLRLGIAALLIFGIAFFRNRLLKAEIVKRRQAEESLQIQKDLSIALNLTNDMDTVLSKILGVCVEIPGIDCGGIYIVREDTFELDLVKHIGLSDRFVDKASHYAADTPQARMVEKGKPVFAKVDDLSFSRSDIMHEEKLLAVCILPILYEKKVLSVMSLASHTHSTISLDARSAIEAIVAQAGGVIARIRKRAALKRSSDMYKSLVDNSPDIIYSFSTVRGGIYYSPRTEEILGYTPSHLCQNPMLWHDAIHQDDVKRVDNAILELAEGEPLDLEYRIKDATGQWHWLHDRSIGKYGNGEEIIIEGLVSDITQRRRMETEIHQSLQEKQVLLKEIHHRVKNNMQIVSSLLKTQARYAKDESTAVLFEESQNRIASMALIHEQLYESGDFAQIRFSDYIQDLVNELYSSFLPASKRIDIQYDLEDVVLKIDDAVPCGLIVNELVTNAFKYAFKQRDNGRISIRLKMNKDNGAIDIIVRDNGIGMEKLPDMLTGETFGLKLVTNLVAHQLSGDYKVLQENGTAFCIRFVP